MFKKHLVIIILFFFNINMLIADAPKKHFNTETHKIITKYLPEYKIVGKANYSFLIWNIYDATLITKSGEFNDDEFVLVLKYNKVIKKPESGMISKKKALSLINIYPFIFLKVFL